MMLGTCRGGCSITSGAGPATHDLHGGETDHWDEGAEVSTVVYKVKAAKAAKAATWGKMATWPS